MANFYLVEIRRLYVNVEDENADRIGVAQGLDVRLGLCERYVLCFDYMTGQVPCVCRLLKLSAADYVALVIGDRNVCASGEIVDPPVPWQSGSDPNTSPEELRKATPVMCFLELPPVNRIAATTQARPLEPPPRTTAISPRLRRPWSF